MPELVPWFLAVHLLGAIVAYGPTFAYPMIRSMGRAEPEHAHFGVRLSAALTDRLVLPVAIVQGLAGVGLIWALQIDLLAPGFRWLLAGIGLYLFVVGYSVLVQRPRVHRLIAATPPGAPPSPELPQIRAAIRRGGPLMTAAIVSIALLMVLKPGS